MPADAGAGEVHEAKRRLVHELADAMEVRSDLFADEGKLVGEGDVHVAERVLCGLHDLGGDEVGHLELALNDVLVKCNHRSAGLGRRAAADA
jgi:hypothetical protein